MSNNASKTEVSQAKIIAHTILMQMGGYGALNIMAGAYDITSRLRGVSFSYKGSKKTNRVAIELEHTDLYTVTFFKVSKPGLKNYLSCDIVKEVKRFEDIGAEGLIDLFEKETGIYLRI